MYQWIGNVGLVNVSDVLKASTILPVHQQHMNIMQLRQEKKHVGHI